MCIQLLAGAPDATLASMGLKRALDAYTYTASGNGLVIGKDDKKDFANVCMVFRCDDLDAHYI